MRIMVGLGFKLVAKSHNRGFYRGGTWQSGGAIDLLGGAVDLVHAKLGHRFVLSSITHLGSEVVRRKKMREAPIDPAFGQGLLWAWDGHEGAFRVYRQEDDYLERGWRLREGDSCWPWENRQLVLET